MSGLRFAEGANFDHHQPVERAQLRPFANWEPGNLLVVRFLAGARMWRTGNCLGTRKPGSYNCCLSIRGGSLLAGSKAQQVTCTGRKSLLDGRLYWQLKRDTGGKYKETSKDFLEKPKIFTSCRFSVSEATSLSPPPRRASSHTRTKSRR